MIPQTILFDLDDTLVHCNKYFNLVIDQFADVMLTWFAGRGLTDKAIKEKQLELDLAGVHVHGFVPERFPQSFIETYRFFTGQFGRPASREEEQFLYKLGNSAYEFRAEPFPDMDDTLRTLQGAGHRLFLYTGGDEAIQRKKVRETGLQRYFDDRIFITHHKNADFMRSLVERHGFDTSSTWMIGNSVTTDVVPALAAGLNCIHIPAHNDWHFNVGEVNVRPQGAFLTLGSLREVPPAIREHARAHS
ncbi:HAD family hydrolase [Gordoniibacillus kamchatkensis]|uniref:HAD family hydrolase n=1 Tax=Gordoniibacillus kamchatkensis TaxID=1590651 RepID=A0ABR5AFG4_9BACL|nr:HAD family hydrolase [Paenibacillus sp. VKM B-2647]KIL39438.1 HAD family hydrolase [Paenibacillus sp. VKM B-2647]